MAYAAVTVEGGLVSADLLERIAATPEDVDGQRPGHFGLAGGRLSDEIQAAFSDLRTYWEAFERRRAHSHESLTSLTREAWAIPVLERLGFDLKYQRAAVQVAGNSYPISHRAGEDALAPPVHIVAADRALDARGDGMRQSPHALVQDYLNRTEPLWGVVTNGVRLRLLRDSARLARPTYVEFDLAAMVQAHLYSEFVLLYRLAHCTRLPKGAADAHECLLEHYYQQGIDEGGRVRERLRDGVKAALEDFGTGFIAHPESEGLRGAVADGRLDAGEVYRQLLRLVYRLLFLMVAEERRLVLVRGAEGAERQEVYTRWYSISRLRERAERRFLDDPHSDLWEGLKSTFRLFRDPAKAAELGVTALDGELFGAVACPDLEQASLGNQALLRAMFHLSTFEETEGRRRRGGRRRVSYAGLDVEELGSVYESLLDYHPHVTLDPPRFELAAGSERKSTGSYYTPPELVRELVGSALVPVVEERLKGAKTRDEKERALLSLKVLDPASGSGHFLLAAARRIGRELAKVRTGEDEPAPAAHREAVRDVIRSSIYAVDKNPLAVDLCKVALWIEGHEAGLPLSFLDHRVKLGDSLIGVFDPGVLAQGIPDDAYKPLTGDDKQAARDYRDRNRRERRGEMALELPHRTEVTEAARAFAPDFGALAELAERSSDEVEAKEELYQSLRASNTTWQRYKRAADLWTAAFFTPLRPTERPGLDPVPTTDAVWRCLDGRGDDQGPRAAHAWDLAEKFRFFHWPLEFPEVFAEGGFDAVLGNPPWERIKLQEQEFFANRDPEIARAPNKAARERLIKALFDDDAWPERKALGHDFLEAKRGTEAAALFVRAGGRFPLTAVGNVNTYAVFAETFLRLISPKGRAGVIVPTGIATDDSTKKFFDEVISKRRLASLFSFENEEFIFPAVHHSTRFCLLTLQASQGTAAKPEFVFFARQPAQLQDKERRFALSPEDIALINPNTKTAPVFRSQADADLTMKIYRRVPVLVDETKGGAGNPWGIEIRRIFNMGKAEVVGACIRRSGAGFVPMYEAKMIHQFDHRWATYEADGQTSRDVTDGEKERADFEPMPRYWVPEREVEERLRAKGWTRRWLMGWRDITSAHVLRTVIAGVVPRLGTDFTIRVNIASSNDDLPYAGLLANLNSLVFDFVARQKIGGTHLADFITKQLPVLPPSAYSKGEIDFILPRVLELAYTADDLRPFARDLGYDGPPYPWDPERRAVLRAELDAYYAYLYGLSRDELRYVLDPGDVMGEDYPSETFRVLKTKEIKAFGEYRTRRLVLEAWDRLEAGSLRPAVARS